MKLSDVNEEIKKFINEFGDKNITGIEVITDNSIFTGTKINYLEVVSDGRYAVLRFTPNEE